MNILRFLMLLSLGVWIGGLILIPIVAQISFSELPSPHLAGIVVRGSLIALHWIGLTCGLIYFFCSSIENRLAKGRLALFHPSHIIVILMAALTAISQFKIIPGMDNLRLSAGEISTLPASDPIRAQFDLLHTWSTRLEGVVLVLGLIVLYLTSHRLSGHT